jgi:hypothetical protein
MSDCREEVFVQIRLSPNDLFGYQDWKGVSAAGFGY